MSILDNLAERILRFTKNRRGNVAMIYALSLVPLTVAASAGLDYARAIVVRSSMSEALDAAALAVGAASGLSLSQKQTLAQQYFNANYRESTSYGTPAPLTVSLSGQSLVLSTTASMPTTMLKLAGIDTMTVAASSSVVWGQLKLWVSLVLDNTNSMTETDATGTSKFSALKTAAHQLLTMLQGASASPGDVQVAIVAFTRDVNVGTSYATASWVDFTDFRAAPPTPAQTVKPGDACPWSDWVDGYHCQSTPANGSATANNIPNSGTYKGYVCPSATTRYHYWNGCFDSVKISSSKYSHTWIPNNTNTWTGCIIDRGPDTGPGTQNYDVTNFTPNPGASAMVAENSPSCVSAAILPLSYNWTALSNKIDSMVLNNNTNQTIGLVWGWHALTQGAPLNPPPLPANTQRIIILVSDGNNTMNRWYGTGVSHSSEVDDRMALACENAKADGVTIFTVFVDLNGTLGNSEVLQNCASSASKYFDLTTTGQIISTFQSIGQQITNLRVSQ
jgi:Flp pilus assembly protein TadG